MAEDAIVIRAMAPDEASSVSALVNTVFDQHVAPYFSEAGATEFRKFSDVSALEKRFHATQCVWVALQAGVILGMIEIRPPNHISLLFVGTQVQHRGIGKALFEHAAAWIAQQNPDTRYVSVNASPNAEGAYARWGFRASHPEQEHNGIRYVPMLYSLL